MATAVDGRSPRYGNATCHNYILDGGVGDAMEGGNISFVRHADRCGNGMSVTVINAVESYEFLVLYGITQYF